MSITIDCPYCEHEHEPTGWYKTDGGGHECLKCGKLFEVHIEYDEYDPDYRTSKMPCVGEHKWVEPPLPSDWMVCSECDAFERKAKEDE